MQNNVMTRKKGTRPLVLLLAVVMLLSGNGFSVLARTVSENEIQAESDNSSKETESIVENCEQGSDTDDSIYENIYLILEKTAYVEGETVTSDELAVTAVCIVDGWLTTIPLTEEEYTIKSQPIDTSKLGKQTLTISATVDGESITQDFEITVIPVPEETPENPVYNAETNDTTWSYVYFGSYPQSEVTDKSITSAIDTAITQMQAADSDYIVKTADTGIDVWVNGTKYRRITIDDTNRTDNFGTVTYRYFKWERMKWRVLENQGSELFLMADTAVDCKKYSKASTTWDMSNLRQWLNESFYNTAFSDREQKIILEKDVENQDNEYIENHDPIDGGNDTRDKIYLLSVEEVSGENYGFYNGNSRSIKMNDYAYRRGGEPSIINEYCDWWLRTVGVSQSHACYGRTAGTVSTFGQSVYDDSFCVVPVLHIDLDSDVWFVENDETSGNGGDNPTASLALTKTTFVQGEDIEQEELGVKCIYHCWWRSENQDETELLSTEDYKADVSSIDTSILGTHKLTVSAKVGKDTVKETFDITIVPVQKGTPANPVYDAQTDSTKWQYVYYGSYPQSEVTDTATITAIENKINATYDGNTANTSKAANKGVDVWINGVKYRRIARIDANDATGFGDAAYRYFKWERIKWKVLQNDNTSLLLMADKALDCESFHGGKTDVTWESSTIRIWLNESFYSNAFTTEEQNSILNKINFTKYYFQSRDTEGYETEDKVYLASMKELTKSAYGFHSNYKTESATRRVQAGAYANALGAVKSIESQYLGNCRFWLRDSGSNITNALDVLTTGKVDGRAVNTTNNGVVPLINVVLSSDEWFTEDDGTSGEGGEDRENVKIPKASISGGSYQGTQRITLSTKTAGAKIYYTTDGSIPDRNNGTKYTGSITINESLTLKAIAVKDGMKDSEIMTEQYTISGTEGESGDTESGDTGSGDTGSGGTGTGGTGSGDIGSGGTGTGDMGTEKEGAESIRTVEEAEEKITSADTDKGDVSGSTFSSLRLKATGKKKSIKLTWKKVKDADGYIIYGAKCGNSMKKIKTIKDNKKVSYTQKKLKKGTYYKYMVVAYKNVDGKQYTIATSKSAHAVTNGDKYGNPTKVTVKASKITLKKGKKKTIKPSYKLPKGKKCKVHIAKFRYESTNTKVATVSKKGVVKAKAKGTAYIYVYAQNGVYKKVKVTVK